MSKKILYIELISEDDEEINVHAIINEIDNAILNCDDSGVTHWDVKVVDADAKCESDEEE